MSFPATIRRYQKPRARLVLAALLVGWLNVALQPCLMAAPQPDNAMVGIQSQVAASSHHVSEPGDRHEFCLHCGTNSGSSQVGFSNCDEFDAAKPSKTPQVTDASAELLAVTRTVWFDQLSLGDRVTSAVVATKESLPRPVSLAIAYCVYLK